MHVRTSMSVWLLAVLVSAPAEARQSDWEVNIAPPYLWASELTGQLDVRDATVPVFMDFADAVDHLSGVFTFHGDARKGRFGVLADVSIVGLSTESSLTIPGLLPSAPPRTASSHVELSNTIVEAAATYSVLPSHALSILGGMRAYTLAPTMAVSTGEGQLAPVDTSETAAAAIVGVLFRPRLGQRVWLITRGDIGGGSGFTWSGTAGVQVELWRRTSLLLGYRALGVRAGTVNTAATATADGDRAIAFNMTHYGPAMAFNLRFGGR